METNKDNKQYRILVSGGGTGGHIFPALSIANEFKRRYPNAEILFIGALGRMEMEKVPAAGYKIIGLPVKGFDRKHLLNNIKVLWQLFKSIRKARSIVREFRPDIAVGVGGYVSGPVLKVAQMQGIPTLIQEQNSYAGVTNKLLAKNADAICVAYEGMEKFFPAEKIVLTGNPIRRNLANSTLSVPEARQRLGLKEDVKTILVVGGSLGAYTINNSILCALDKIKSQPIQVLWQTGKHGKKYKEAVSDVYKAANVHQTEFIADMEAAYRAADLVVSRAGASSISELQILGKPVILIPSPNVAEDHQTKNALALSDKGAAVMIRDNSASRELVDTMLKLIQDDERLASLSANITKMALVNADETIVDKAEEIIRGN